MKRQASQKTMILEYLKSEDGRRFGISPLEALKLFGCFRLADVIFKLRKSGYSIDHACEENYFRYFLADEEAGL